MTFLMESSLELRMEVLKYLFIKWWLCEQLWRKGIIKCIGKAIHKKAVNYFGDENNEVVAIVALDAFLHGACWDQIHVNMSPTLHQQLSTCHKCICRDLRNWQTMDIASSCKIYFHKKSWSWKITYFQSLASNLLITDPPQPRQWVLSDVSCHKYSFSTRQFCPVSFAYNFAIFQPTLIKQI